MEGGVQGGQPVFSPAYVSWQKSRVWVVTFISYTCFHLARKVSGARTNRPSRFVCIDRTPRWPRGEDCTGRRAAAQS